MPIRITGLNSGLDTEAIISALVSSYDYKTKKYEKAQKVKEKLDDFISRNGKLREIICKVLEAVKMNNREMEQYLVVMGDEAEHNYESLRRVMDALRHYEASPGFSSLPRVEYGDFSAH